MWTDWSVCDRQTSLAPRTILTPPELSRRTLFREVNARIREITARFGTTAATYVVLCECGEDGCMKRVEVPAAVYEEVVDRGRERFLVAPGHERHDLDRLVSRNAGYSVVELEAATRPGGAALLRVVPTGPVGRAD